MLITRRHIVLHYKPYGYQSIFLKYDITREQRDVVMFASVKSQDIFLLVSHILARVQNFEDQAQAASALIQSSSQNSRDHLKR